MARRLLGAAILSLSLAACSQQSEAARLAILDGVPESHIVGLDDEVVGTRTNGSRMEVVFVYQDSESEWRTDRIASGDFEPGTNSHQLSTGSGLGLNWNTFLYGTAALGTRDLRAALTSARGVRISRQKRLPCTASTLSGPVASVSQPANDTGTSVWQDAALLLAKRSWYAH